MTNWSAERLVKEHEGRRLSVCVDSRGFRTVGYGHRLVRVGAGRRARTDAALVRDGAWPDGSGGGAAT